MTETVEWLRARLPAFAALGQDEQDAITSFSLLWGLFEARILDYAASVSSICAAVEKWSQAGTLHHEDYRDEVAYFRQRYVAAGKPTHHFEGLHLRDNDRKKLVLSVLLNPNSSGADQITACLIIVFRYRNNLFHGLKWQFELQGQLGNFTAANAILKKTLDRHGDLAAS
jgi:hypothetical protein